MITPQEARQRTRTLVEHYVNECESVSYTHLDVYKRQVCSLFIHNEKRLE